MKKDIADLEAKIAEANAKLPAKKEMMVEQWELVNKSDALIKENESLEAQIKDLLEKTELEKVKAKIFDSENDKQQAANAETKKILDARLQKIADLNANIAALQKQLYNLSAHSALTAAVEKAAAVTDGL